MRKHEIQVGAPCFPKLPSVHRGVKGLGFFGGPWLGGGDCNPLPASVMTRLLLFIAHFALDYCRSGLNVFLRRFTFHAVVVQNTCPNNGHSVGSLFG